MLLEQINHIFQRELETLSKELLEYENEKDIWQNPEGLKNSTGTLAIHLIGNLRHFIGATLGNSGYVRDRQAEFSDRNIAREEIIVRIEHVKAEVESALLDLPEDILEKQYPIEVGGVRMQTLDFLFHLMSHFAYHLGQLDYHRRIVTKQTHGVGAVSMSELKTAKKVQQ
jgi:uncharacterized damage-inducible protein DinB